MPPEVMLILLILGVAAVTAALGGALGYELGRRRGLRMHVTVQADTEVVLATLHHHGLVAVPRGVEWTARREGE